MEGAQKAAKSGRSRTLQSCAARWFVMLTPGGGQDPRLPQTLKLLPFQKFILQQAVKLRQPDGPATIFRPLSLYVDFRSLQLPLCSACQCHKCSIVGVFQRDKERCVLSPGNLTSFRDVLAVPSNARLVENSRPSQNRSVLDQYHVLTSCSDFLWSWASPHAPVRCPKHQKHQRHRLRHGRGEDEVLLSCPGIERVCSSAA